MKVVRQDDNRRNVERLDLSRFVECVSQLVDVIDEKTATPFQEIDSEEPASAGDEGSAIVRHAASVLCLGRATPSGATIAGRNGGLRFANPPYM
jgi:hypothetical protein